MLALRANRTVSAEELIDGLYAERPPESAAKNVQLHVSRLRKALAFDHSGASIVTHGRGYELKLSEEAVDALRFEQLVEDARGDAERGIADGAARTRSSSGAGRRSPTSLQSRLPDPRSAGSRSFICACSS